MSVRLNAPQSILMCDQQLDASIYYQVNGKRQIRLYDVLSQSVITTSGLYANALSGFSALHTSGFIYYYDTVLQQFVRINKDNVDGNLAVFGAQHIFAGGALEYGATDPTDGLIYVGIGTVDFATYAPGTDTVTALTPLNSNGVLPAGYDISDIAIDLDGTLWVFAYNPADPTAIIYRGNKTSGVLLHYADVLNLPVQSVAFDIVGDHGFVGVADGANGGWNGVGYWTLPNAGDAALLNIVAPGDNTIEISNAFVEVVSFLRRFSIGACGDEMEICDLGLDGAAFTTKGAVGSCN